MILRTVCILLLIIKWQSSLYSQTETSSLHGLSAGYFIGSMHYNKLDNTARDYYSKPHNLKTQGVAIKFSFPLKNKNYISLNGYLHSFHTRVHGGYLTYEDYHNDYSFYAYSQAGVGWNFEANCTRAGIIPTLNHIIGKSTRRIVSQFSLGIGLEETISNNTITDSYYQYNKSWGRHTVNGPNNEPILEDFYNYHVTTPDDATATKHFGTKTNPNTVVLNIGLGLNAKITQRINLLVDANYRIYANAYAGSIGSYYLSKMYWASVQLQYQFGSKK